MIQRKAPGTLFVTIGISLISYQQQACDCLVLSLAAPYIGAAPPSISKPATFDRSIKNNKMGSFNLGGGISEEARISQRASSLVSSLRMLLDYFVVIGVTAYPEPQEAIGYLNSQCPIMHPYTD
jgi:hypothetical protein